MRKSVLLVGEPMGLFMADSVGELEKVESFSLTTCGAELNVAIGLKRLGHNVTYLTKLGNDLFGRRIAGDPAICYFRRNSAASTLAAEDVETMDFSKFDMVHLTGITPALSKSARAASEVLNAQARKAGCFFSFDPNLRPQLWTSREEMANCINSLAYRSDLFLPGIKEAELLIGETEPRKIAAHYLERGTKTVVVKLGPKGAYYICDNGDSGCVDGFHVEHVVDTVGAGDGFAVGVLSAWREGLPLDLAVQRGCAVGAIQVMSRGDNDGLPSREELDAFMAGQKDWRRHSA